MLEVEADSVQFCGGDGREGGIQEVDVVVGKWVKRI